MAQHYKIEKIEGYQQIITPETSDLEFLNCGIIRFSEGEIFKDNTKKNETVFVITEGNCNFFLENKLFGKMKRTNVFDEPPVAVYLPPFLEYRIEFIGKTEICVLSCLATGKGTPLFIDKKDVKFRRVGEEVYFRNITDILTEESSSERLLLGETINDPGNWSSYPPHKHDKDNPPVETKLEELYFFKIKPKSGFGVMRIFDETEDNIFVVKNDEVITIPKGYHPVAVAPKFQIYYLWVLCGNTKKLISFTHPDFSF